MQNVEHKMKCRTRRRRLSFCILHFAFCIGLAGCASHPTTQPTTRPLSTRERQDQAIRDPFAYSPDAGKTDISGGGLTEFDRDGLRKDLKNALDP